MRKILFVSIIVVLLPVFSFAHSESVLNDGGSGWNMMSGWNGMMSWGGLWFWIFTLSWLVWTAAGVLLVVWLIKKLLSGK